MNVKLKAELLIQGYSYKTFVSKIKKVWPKCTIKYPSALSNRIRGYVSFTENEIDVISSLLGKNIEDLFFAQRLPVEKQKGR